MDKMKHSMIDAGWDYLMAGLSGAGLAVGVSWGEEIMKAFIIGLVGGIGGIVARFLWKKVRGK